jgi:hypothetical protein
MGCMMSKIQNKFDVKLDQKEEDILASVERGEWKTVDNLEEETAFAKQAAGDFKNVA